MAARGPGTTFSALRALGALAVVVLFFASIVFFGVVVADYVNDQFGDDGGSEEGPADNGGTDDPGQNASGDDDDSLANGSQDGGTNSTDGEPDTNG